MAQKVKGTIDYHVMSINRILVLTNSGVVYIDSDNLSTLLTFPSKYISSDIVRAPSFNIDNNAIVFVNNGGKLQVVDLSLVGYEGYVS